ncbi:hypothetical protein Tsubulata_003049 [Turnera subulata]|uniref:RNB domain-containing protein n=1 Tax=Turnera subulata TaxID=218843 RepID=A0A9Q0JBZ9_9ROSI|nr:hypothetical protein Tsubulata_003049 [Turnera subulata]
MLLYAQYGHNSIAEYSVDNTIVRPTYMLTYTSASELLYLNLEEEVELKLLSKAAAAMASPTVFNMLMGEGLHCLHAFDTLFKTPTRHGVLGLPGYVQFTSPIRRYMDLLAHYQPIERTYRALILRFIKDQIAAVLLVEVGLQASARVSQGSKVGDEIKVMVERVHPRDDILFLEEVDE